MPRSANSSATATRNGVSMPAPAPCAQRKRTPASVGPVIKNCVIGLPHLPPRPSRLADPGALPWSRHSCRSRLVLAKRRQRFLATIIARIKGQFVGHQRGEIGGLGNRKVGGQIAVQEARTLQLREPWKVLDGIKAKVIEELLGGAVGDWAPRGATTTAGADPTDLHQHVKRAGGGRNAADLLDFGPRNGLMVGDDGQRLHGRLRQSALLDSVALQEVGEILCRAKCPLSRHLDEVDAAACVKALELLKQGGDVIVRPQVPPQILL